MIGAPFIDDQKIMVVITGNSASREHHDFRPFFQSLHHLLNPFSSLHSADLKTCTQQATAKL